MGRLNLTPNQAKYLDSVLIHDIETYYETLWSMVHEYRNITDDETIVSYLNYIDAIMVALDAVNSNYTWHNEGSIEKLVSEIPIELVEQSEIYNRYYQ